MKNELPELPQRCRRLQQQCGLEPREAAFLTAARETADFFEAAAESYSDYRNLANWIQGELVYQLRETGLEISAVEPGLLAELLLMLDSGEISRPTAKELLPELLQSGTSPRLLVQKRGLGRICGRAALEPLVERVLAENSDAAESFRQGKEKALSFLVGRVMALTGGRADTGEVNVLLREKLNRSPSS